MDRTPFLASCLAGLLLAAAPASAAAPARALAVTVADPGDDGPVTLSGGTVWKKTIKRYEDTVIIGIAEYDPFNCIFLDKGEWSDPKPSLNPKSSGKITVRDLAGKVTGGSCDGLPVTFRTIYFKWTLARNWTGRKGEGPLALFSARWFTKDAHYNEPYDFEVTVPAVRPIGEKTVLGAWVVDARGAYGRWVMTLIPPKSPRENAEFDFGGEVIRERNTVLSNACGQRAPTALGPPSVTPEGKEATWTVGQVLGGPAGRNQWGTDDVGWSACAIHAYRCAKATQPACSAVVRQQIYIKSDADKDFVGPLYTNILSETIGGTIFTARDQIGFGEVRSRRADAPEAFNSYTSSERSCGPAVLSYLKRLPNGCYGKGGP